MRCFILLAALAIAGPATAAVNVLFNSAHGANQFAQALNILIPGELGTSVVADRTVCSASDPTYDPTFLADSVNPLLSFYNIQSGNCGPPVTGAENLVPYQVLNQSFSNPPLESDAYATLESVAAGFSNPYLTASCQLQVCQQPPIYITYTIAAGIGQLSGPGDEFVISAGYKGFTTDAPSWATADMAAMLAALKFNHPTWNMLDAIGALRQTAANWSTGYDAASGGYGVIDYDAAEAIASSSSIYLEPPLMLTADDGDYAVIRLYPFRQSRRAHEVVYSASASYVWPVKNEYTTSDIASSGATLIYTGNATDVIPTFNYAPAVSGTITLIAFTTDGSGGYSRAEPFSEQSVTITVPSQCN